MRTCIVELDGVTSSSIVGAILVMLSRIGHGGGRVMVKLNGVVPVDACSCEVYAHVNG